MGRDKNQYFVTMYFRPYENLPKSEAERKWWERIMALGCPVEKIRKPFWYKYVKAYIFPNRCPERSVSQTMARSILG